MYLKRKITSITISFKIQFRVFKLLRNLNNLIFIFGSQKYFI